jgi:WD40 repeat protein
VGRRDRRTEGARSERAGPVAGYTPDGAHLLSATKTRDTGELVVTDAATGAEVERYAHGTGALCAATATPDSKRLVTVGEDGAITVWDRATRAPVRFDESPRGFLYTIALSPDGGTLFVRESDSVARLWDANTGLRLHALAAPMSSVLGATFSQDSSRVFVTYYHSEHALTADAAVRQWNVADGALVRAYQLPVRHPSPFVLAPDASHLFVKGKEQLPGADAGARNWNRRGAQKDLFLGADARTGARLPDVPAGWNHSVVAYPKRGELIEVHNGEHEGYKHEYVATNRLTGAVLGKWKVPITPNLRAVSPDGKLVATDEPAEDHTKPIVIRRVTGERLCVAPVERESYWTVFAFSPCGRLAASASGDTVIVFDPETGRVVRTLRGHTGRVTALAFSANGKRLASGSSDSTVLIWDVTAP